jgi:hypothetical protein
MSAEAVKLLRTAEEDFDSMRLAAAKEKYGELLRRFGSDRAVAEQADPIARRVAYCEGEIGKASDEIKQDLERGAQMEEAADWGGAVAVYQGALEKSRVLGLPFSEGALNRSKTEREAQAVLGFLKNAVSERQWTTALSLADYLQQKFGSTRTVARSARMILETATAAERRLAPHVVLWEEGFDNGVKNWKAASAGLPPPRAESTPDAHDGPAACRLIFGGPGRIALPIAASDDRAQAITFWAKAPGAATALFFVNEAKEEIALTREWRLFRVPLEGRLREIGFETSAPMELTVDSIRLTGP